MESFFLLNQWTQSDLYLYQCGRSKIEPGHAVGPSVKNHYLIHFVLAGRGYFRFGEREFEVEQGQAFIISPGTLFYYESDEVQPWTYAWVAFSGLCAQRLMQSVQAEGSPVLGFSQPFVDACFDQLLSCRSLSAGRELRALGYLYVLLSQLIEEHACTSKENSQAPEDYYVKQAIRFIEIQYNRAVSISEVAEYIGLHRSYLFSLFKKHMQISPQAYLIQYRIQRACELLEDSSLSIGDISRSVGYDDPLVFSKRFKKRMNVSPSAFRQRYYKKQRK